MILPVGISCFLITLILFLHFFNVSICSPQINTFPKYNFLTKLLFIADVSARWDCCPWEAAVNFMHRLLHSPKLENWRVSPHERQYMFNENMIKSTFNYTCNKCGAPSRPWAWKPWPPSPCTFTPQRWRSHHQAGSAPAHWTSPQDTVLGEVRKVSSVIAVILFWLAPSEKQRWM